MWFGEWEKGGTGRSWGLLYILFVYMVLNGMTRFLLYPFKDSERSVFTVGLSQKMSGGGGWLHEILERRRRSESANTE